MNCVCAVSRAYSIHRANCVGEKGHRRTLLPLWGNSPVVPKPLQGDAHVLFRRIRGRGGVGRKRKKCSLIRGMNWRTNGSTNRQRTAHKVADIPSCMAIQVP